MYKWNLQLDLDSSLCLDKLPAVHVCFITTLSDLSLSHSGCVIEDQRMLHVSQSCSRIVKGLADLVSIS